jgi:hypothetical protein
VADPLSPEPVTSADALEAELELALVTAREQQALLRSSLATVMGFLDRQTGY